MMYDANGLNIGSFPRRLVVMAGCLIVSFSACSVHQVDAEPELPFAIPASFGSEALRENQGSGEPSADQWWTQFGDPGLNSVVSRALEQNFDIRIALARLDQARAAAKGATAAWWPRLTADIGTSRSQSVLPFGTFTNNQFDMSLGLSYEVDFWNKVGSRADAAELDAGALADDVRTAAMGLAAQLADLWIQRTEQLALVALLERQRNLNDTYLELVRLRFGQGLGAAVDVLQQRQRMEAIVAQLPAAESRLQLLSHQIAVLSGGSPGEALPHSPSALPALPAPPSLGVPADLLERRPDVRAARARVVAADHRVAAAVAEYLPTLRLSASTGFRALELPKLFESWVYSLAASLSQLIWDGGARGAEQDRLEAIVRENLLRYGQVVLVAMREVEDAAVQERWLRQQLAEVDQQVRTAEVTLEQTRLRYVQGLTDYLPVLTALSAVQQLEQSQLAIRRQIVSSRILLYRALGGSWMNALARPAGDSEDQDADQDAQQAVAPSLAQESE